MIAYLQWVFHNRTKNEVGTNNDISPPIAKESKLANHDRQVMNKEI